MHVILKKEVENLGAFGDKVKVADGYARNYLIPKGFAVEATPGNVRQFAAERDAYLKKAAEKKAQAEKRKAEVETITLTFTRKAAEEEKLFGSVTVHDIEEALKAHGLQPEKKDIILAEPIKTAGEHTAQVKLHPGVVATVKVKVEKEQ